MPRVIKGEAGVYAAVATLWAVYGQWAAGSMLFYLHIFIGWKFLYILQSQRKSEVLVFVIKPLIILHYDLLKL